MLRRRSSSSLLVAIVWLSAIAPTSAQVKQGEPAGPKMGESHVSRWQVGMIVTASGGACRDLTGYVPVPTDWPEQQVTIVEEDISPEAKVSYEMVDGGVKIMNVRIPQLAAGQEAKALVTVEIRRSAILPPENTDIYVLPDPKKLPREIRPLPDAQSEDREPRSEDSRPGQDRSAPTRRRPGRRSRRSTTGSARR